MISGSPRQAEDLEGMVFLVDKFISSHDPQYETQLNEFDLDKEATYAQAEMVARSQRLFGLLCSLLRGRPLMLIRTWPRRRRSVRGDSDPEE